MLRIVFAAEFLLAFTTAFAQQIPAKPLLRPADSTAPKALPSEILGTVPAQAKPTSLPAAPEPQQKFDSSTLQLKGDRGQWQLWAGGLLLKDFGSAQADAQEALRLFRELSVDAHGTVGGVFDYWLSHGDAPFGVARQRQIVNFDSTSLRTEQVNGNWVLRDSKSILYNFGRSQSDADDALAVCRRYGFNQLGFIGGATPSLKYLMRDVARRLPDASSISATAVPVRMQANEIVLPPLSLPGYGVVGEREGFDYRKLEVKRDGGEFVLMTHGKSFGRFGASEREARATANVLTEFRCTELCRIGDARFFLSNGRAPQGTTVGLAARTFRPESLTVRQSNGVWGVADGNRMVVEVGTRQDADRALAAIREFRFDGVCNVGQGRLGNVNLFVRSR